MPLIWCHVQPFLGVMVFIQFFGSFFPICLTILCTSISTIFFSNFSTWEFHSHFVGIRYITWGPIERNVVYFGSLLRFSPYNNLPYLCFPFLGGRYTYSRSYIRCGSYIFTIVGGIISIRALSAISKMCSLWLDHSISLPFNFFYS